MKTMNTYKRPAPAPTVPVRRAARRPAASTRAHSGASSYADPYARSGANPYASPYDPPAAGGSHGPVVSAGMSLAEMIAWLVVMAALAVGMIWLLWHTTR